MRYLALLLAMMSLIGCANDYNWVSRNPSANFQQDLDACVKSTNAATTNGYSGQNVVNPEISETYVPAINSACAGNFGIFGCNNGMPDTVSDLDRCLMTKGWRMKRAP